MRGHSYTAQSGRRPLFRWQKQGITLALFTMFICASNQISAEDFRTASLTPGTEMLRQSDLPTVLSAADQARYQRIFALEARAAWSEADAEIAGLADKLLLGQVQAARYLSRFLPDELCRARALARTLRRRARRQGDLPARAAPPAEGRQGPAAAGGGGARWRRRRRGRGRRRGQSEPARGAGGAPDREPGADRAAPRRAAARRARGAARPRRRRESGLARRDRRGLPRQRRSAGGARRERARRQRRPDAAAALGGRARRLAPRPARRGARPFRGAGAQSRPVAVAQIGSRGVVGARGAAPEAAEAGGVLPAHRRRGAAHVLRPHRLPPARHRSGTRFRARAVQRARRARHLEPRSRAARARPHRGRRARAAPWPNCTR